MKRRKKFKNLVSLPVDLGSLLFCYSYLSKISLPELLQGGSWGLDEDSFQSCKALWLPLLDSL